MCGHVSRLGLKSGNQVGFLEDGALRFRLELWLEFDYLAVLEWDSVDVKRWEEVKAQDAERNHKAKRNRDILRRLSITDQSSDRFIDCFRRSHID